MTSTMRSLLAILVLTFVTGGGARGEPVESLRGDAAIDETAPAPEIKRQNTQAGRFVRAYRQQPPMIPHRVDRYQIDLRVNKCLGCHDWPNNVEEGAPKVSETHYVSREGIALDHLARTRWFCTQCHVPQANTRPLVSSTFKSSRELD